MDATLNMAGPGNSARLPGPSIRLEKILAPIDFSTASRQGMRASGQLAATFHAKLELLYVIEPPSLPEWGYVHLEFRDIALRNEATQRLATFATECGVDPAFVGERRVRSGYPENHICLEASERNSDLIVMASNARSGLKHAWLGSVVERVIRHAPCPVLALPERPGLPETGEVLKFKRVFVTTDFSSPSKKAIPYAIAFARKFEAALTLVHVSPTHWPAEIGHIGGIIEETRLLDQARAELPRFRAAELDPYLHVETLLLNGAPAHQICDAARTQACDLIVIATHGHSGFMHFALGSVAERVVRHSPCPVLVVREREHDFVNP